MLTKGMQSSQLDFAAPPSRLLSLTVIFRRQSISDRAASGIHFPLDSLPVLTLIICTIDTPQAYVYSLILYSAGAP